MRGIEDIAIQWLASYIFIQSSNLLKSVCLIVAFSLTCLHKDIWMFTLYRLLKDDFVDWIFLLVTWWTAFHLQSKLAKRGCHPYNLNDLETSKILAHFQVQVLFPLLKEKKMKTLQYRQYISHFFWRISRFFKKPLLPMLSFTTLNLSFFCPEAAWSP